MILLPEVLSLFILNFIFSVFTIIVFVSSIKIFINWDINATTKLQYDLEKQTILSATIIKYIFSIKIPLFLFFIFTLDKLSNVLTGAMCGAGVVDATEFGNTLIVLKVLNLYLFALWLKLHVEDVKLQSTPYTRVKFGFFIVLFFFILSEVILEGMMFNALEIDKLVSCCGSLYSSSTSSAIGSLLSLDNATIVSAFYINFAFIALFYFLKKNYLFAISNSIFIVVAIISLISFFGTYIYQLPSHHCLFCLLQGDYYHIGYFLYSSLFIATFYGLAAGIIKDSKRSYNISMLFNTFYVFVLSLYVIVYYLRNGVWL